MKRIIISIDEAVHEHLRLIAFTERKSITEIVRELLKKGLEERRHTAVRIEEPKTEGGEK